MPDLDFKITGVQPAERGLTPLIQFKLEVTNTPATEAIHTVMLQAQIQLQTPRRHYTVPQKEKLTDLFGTPDRWGQTLRTRLWTHASTVVSAFTGATTAAIWVPCTFDLNVSAAKYFYALDDGEIPLLFLFSGTVFYAAPDGRLQAQQISWNEECSYRMPVSVWRELMDHHYPNTAWITVHRDVFEKLCALKRREGLPDWDQLIERLLAGETVAAGKEDIALTP